ncbi:MAG: peptidase M14 [Acidobacteria bacterium]|nr:peptidase M14 [Acidobacteriota bacterium]
MMREFISCLLAASLLAAQQPAPPDPAWDRLYPNAKVLELMRGYERSYPGWVKVESLGKTSAGGDTWLMTITNPATGAASSKPAVYVDGSTHANEIQGTETTMYIVNFVLKNYGKLPRVTEFLDRATLYLIPMMNIDSRERWFRQPSNPNFPRTLPVPLDDDRDGLIDEDGYDDLNGDGEITMMRKKVPLGRGNFKLDPKDPRLLIPVGPNELGNYIMLGFEGSDNDGDGQVNEDLYGYVDPNRVWGDGFQPRYVQNGASEYPLQYPEARNIAEWMGSHFNVNVVMSYHNFGKLILRMPGARSQRPMPQVDLRVHDFLGKEGELMLPGYKYVWVAPVLGDSYGSSADHTYGRVGAFSVGIELNAPQQDFNNDKNVSQDEVMKFNDELTQGRMFVDWKPFNHPQFGEIEIGGYKHDTGRSPEGFLSVEEYHRNAMYVLLHGFHLPKLVVQTPEVIKVKEGLYRLHIPILNERMIPSVSGIVAQNRIHRQDLAMIEGVKVLASGTVTDRFMNRVELQQHRPERLMVSGGIDGVSTRTLMFLIEARPGKVKFVYDSLKAGKISKEIELP